MSDTGAKFGPADGVPDSRFSAMEVRRVKTMILKSTVETSRHFAQSVPGAEAERKADRDAETRAVLALASSKGGQGEEQEEQEEDDYLGIDAFGAFDKLESGAPRATLASGSGSGGGEGEGFCEDEFDKWFDRAWDVEYGETYEDELRSRETPIERRMGVTVPAVVARGSPPTNYTCFACGTRPAYDMQTPDDVFAVGYRLGGPELAVHCVKRMAQLLKGEDYNAVLQRAGCCRTVRCMLAQNRLGAENYEAWFFSGGPDPQRKQLERGTDRKDQGLDFGDSIIFLRALAVQKKPKIVTDAELLALLKWVIVNAQFVQEREKNFIATAMAVIEQKHLFGYTFADPQSLANRMAAFARTYLERVLFQHLLDEELPPWKWRSGANKYLETAMPKPSDVLYALMCDDNWKAQGSPRDDNGRRVHRVPKDAPHARLFGIDAFHEALDAALLPYKKTKDNPGAEPMKLPLACGNALSTASTGQEQPRELQKLLKMMAGSHKRTYAIAHGKAAAPTGASRQKDSGVHPRQRYLALPRAEGYTEDECADFVDLFVDDHPNGNTVGFEKEKSDDPASLSKACSVLRMPTLYEPKKVQPVSEVRRRLERCNEPVELKRKSKHAPGVGPRPAVP